MADNSPDDIDLSAGPGHRVADEHLAHLKLGRSFLDGPHESNDIMQLRSYVRESDGMFVAKVWFGPGAQGPPGHAHGGSMAAVLDEALGSACWVAGHAVVAAELTTSFRKMLPLDTVATAEAWIEEVDGRKLHVRGHIIADDGTAFAEATGLFIEMKPETVESLDFEHKMSKDA